ncbi:MAG TPA: FAD/NAD(P)-binding oxidoreductase [Pirellulales bacterium]|nr:FAD/NAD(P)-binding oxidoreductase [Pirellulales bacterium]
MIVRPLVIVGAGPAGMAAAIAAAEVGLEPLVIDENPQIGGQIHRQPPAPLASKPADSHGRAARRGSELLSRFRANQGRITLLSGTSVWAVFPPRRVAIRGPQGAEMIEAEQLILAQGAFEYVPPFPGWTLPGVMTPGGAQQMVKIMRVRPGRRALVAGSGPFLLVVAEQLHRAGMEVAGVVEAASTAELVAALPRLWLHPSLAWDGMGYLNRLRRAQVPIHRGQIVVAAEGERELCRVVVAPCDTEWRPDTSRARTIDADTLAIAYGFAPRTQLAQLAGCKMRFANELGGWVPEVDKSLETSVPGVWVAGDGGGAAGALVAQDQGTLAALAAGRRSGAVDSIAFARATAGILRRLRRLRHFRAILDRLSQIRPGLDTLATPDTIVCRCEELTRAEVAGGLAFGGTDLRTLKVMTRLGMGACQGAMCWPAAARWIAAQSGRSIGEIGPASVRPPVSPVCVGDLAAEISP